MSIATKTRDPFIVHYLLSHDFDPEYSDIKTKDNLTTVIKNKKIDPFYKFMSDIITKKIMLLMGKGIHVSLSPKDITFTVPLTYFSYPFVINDLLQLHIFIDQFIAFKINTLQLKQLKTYLGKEANNTVEEFLASDNIQAPFKEGNIEIISDSIYEIEKFLTLNPLQAEIHSENTSLTSPIPQPLLSTEHLQENPQSIPSHDNHTLSSSKIEYAMALIDLSENSGDILSHPPQPLNKAIFNNLKKSSSRTSPSSPKKSPRKNQSHPEARYSPYHCSSDFSPEKTEKEKSTHPPENKSPQNGHEEQQKTERKSCKRRLFSN